MQSDCGKLGTIDCVRQRLLFAPYCPETCKQQTARSAAQKLGNLVKLEFVDAPREESNQETKNIRKIASGLSELRRPMTACSATVCVTSAKYLRHSAQILARSFHCAPYTSPIAAESLWRRPSGRPHHSTK